MKTRYLLTIFLIASMIAGVATSGCLYAKSNSNKPVEITVSAAISLSDALKDMGTEFQKKHPEVRIYFNFGASGTLQKQIEQGAPVDIFASASEHYMDLLEEKGLIINSTRTNFTGNKLVILAPSNLTIEELKHLDKIAIGDPKFVPAGRYAKTFLENAGIYEMLKPRLIFAGDVRQVLEYVERGEVDAGFVYSSDTKIIPNDLKSKLSISAINDTLYPPIVYPIAVIKGSRNPQVSEQFIEYIRSDEGQTILHRYGFG